MRALFSWPLIFFMVGIAASAMMFGTFKIEYGTVDFFQKHGYVFLVFMTFFPRLTLLFSSVPFGGFFWWLGFFFYPRILVAVLATIAYLQTNPFLVYVSWVVAISGEVLEKKGLRANKRFIFRRYTPGNFSRGPEEVNRELFREPQRGGDVIDAEFTRKD